MKTCTRALSIALSTLALTSVGTSGEVPLSSTIEFNGNHYIKVTPPAGITWLKARAIAANQYVVLPDGTVLKGHLVTITSQEEQDFVSSTFLTQNWQQLWLGAFQFSPDSEPAGNWAWVTGEEIGDPLVNWGYAFLDPGQPGEDPNVYNSNENALRMQINGGTGTPPGTGNDGWGDFPHVATGPQGLLGVIVEFDHFGDNFFGLERPPMLVSNSHWRSSDVLTLGWEELGFDDSTWAFARAPYPSPATPGSLIAGTHAQFMWHDPLGTSVNGTTGAVETFYRCQFYMDLPTLALYVKANATISVDDDYDLYVNGELAFENHDGGYAGVVDVVDISPWLRYGENVIGIHAVDGAWGNPHNRIYERVLFDLRMSIVDSLAATQSLQAVQ